MVVDFTEKDEKKEDTKKEAEDSGDKEEDAGDARDGDAPKRETGLEHLDRVEKNIIEYNKATERREKANNITAELLARQKLGGRAEAGQPIEKKEETAKEYKDRVMRGDA